jgi:hypothetical protein
MIRGKTVLKFNSKCAGHFFSELCYFQKYWRYYVFVAIFCPVDLLKIEAHRRL